MVRKMILHTHLFSYLFNSHSLSANYVLLDLGSAEVHKTDTVSTLLELACQLH